MEIVRVQVLASVSEEEKRKALVEKLEAISYLKIEEDVPDNFDIVQAFEDDRSDVVLMFEHFNGNGYVSSLELTNHYPTKAVLMIKSDNSKINIREVVQSGASDIISYGADIQTLTELIYATYKNHTNKQEMLRSGEGARQSHEGKVFTVFSTKGGTGKTFTSTNLAVTLAKDSDKRVALVDLDLDYGGVDLALDLKSKTSITNVIEDIQHLDSDLMESYLVRHSSGAYVLTGDSSPNMGDYVEGEHIERIIEILKLSFDYIILDMPGRFIDVVGPAIALSNSIFLITVPEILTLKNTRSALKIFEDSDYPMERVKILLNKVSFGGIGRRDVEKTLGYDVFEEIPEDAARVRKSQNEGKPYVLTYKNRPITKAFSNIVDKGILSIK